MYMKALMTAHPVRIALILLGLIAIGAGLWYAARPPATSIIQTAKVERGSVRFLVDVTGRVEPSERLELSFPASGTVASVFVKEGEAVAAGAPLVALDTALLTARLNEVRAAVARESAARAELLAGARSEDIAVARASKEKTATALEHSADDLVGVIERGFVLGGNILRTAADPLFENPDTPNPSFGIGVLYGGTTYRLSASGNAGVNLALARKTIGAHRVLWQELLRGDDVQTTLDARALQALGYLGELQTFLDAVQAALADYTDGNATIKTAFASYSSALEGGRTSISSLLVETRAAHEAFAAAQNSDTVATREFARSEAGPTTEQIAAQNAALALARAQEEAAETALAQATLVAPHAGVVADIYADPGEFLSPGTPALTVDVGDTPELVAYVPESDIAHVMVGQYALGTFDAFDRNEAFAFRVSSVANVETMRDGVATYKTILLPDTPDPRLKSGMTADLSVVVEERQDVLMVPSRAIKTYSGSFSCIIMDSGEERCDIVSGLHGTEGFTEIISGLEKGEKVVVGG